MAGWLISGGARNLVLGVKLVLEVAGRINHLVSSFEFGVSGFGFWVSGFRFRVLGFRFWVSGFGWKVEG